MTLTYIKAKSHKGIWLSITKKEALELIISLSNQIRANNPNSGRLESYTSDKREYVSIGVESEEPRLTRRVLEHEIKQSIFLGSISKKHMDNWKRRIQELEKWAKQDPDINKVKKHA